MDDNSLWMVVWGTTINSRCRTASSCWTFHGWRQWVRWRPMSSHRCSMVERSGEIAGHGRTVLGQETHSNIFCVCPISITLKRVQILVTLEKGHDVTSQHNIPVVRRIDPASAKPEGLPCDGSWCFPKQLRYINPIYLYVPYNHPCNVYHIDGINISNNQLIIDYIYNITTMI